MKFFKYGILICFIIFWRKKKMKKFEKFVLRMKLINETSELPFKNIIFNLHLCIQFKSISKYAINKCLFTELLLVLFKYYVLLNFKIFTTS